MTGGHYGETSMVLDQGEARRDPLGWWHQDPTMALVAAVEKSPWSEKKLKEPSGWCHQDLATTLVATMEKPPWSKEKLERCTWMVPPRPCYDWWPPWRTLHGLGAILGAWCHQDSAMTLVATMKKPPWPWRRTHRNVNFLHFETILRRTSSLLPL